MDRGRPLGGHVFDQLPQAGGIGLNLNSGNNFGMIDGLRRLGFEKLKST
jgi:hypothetical protein